MIAEQTSGNRKSWSRSWELKSWTTARGKDRYPRNDVKHLTASLMTGILQQGRTTNFSQTVPSTWKQVFGHMSLWRQFSSKPSQYSKFGKFSSKISNLVKSTLSIFFFNWKYLLFSYNISWLYFPLPVLLPVPPHLLSYIHALSFSHNKQASKG